MVVIWKWIKKHWIISSLLLLVLIFIVIPSSFIVMNPEDYEDPDGDGLFNLREARLGTDPENPDTDGDGVVDGEDYAPLNSSVQIKNAQEIERTKEYLPPVEIIEEEVSQFSACDFLPDGSAIPTEFLIGNVSEDNESCSQSYRQANPYGTVFSVKVYACWDSDLCNAIYTNKSQELTSVRGYTELESEKDCTAIRRENAVDSIVSLLCSWEYLVFEETVYESGWFDTYTLVTEIPQNVADKVTDEFY